MFFARWLVATFAALVGAVAGWFVADAIIGQPVKSLATFFMVNGVCVAAAASVASRLTRRWRPEPSPDLAWIVSIVCSVVPAMVPALLPNFVAIVVYYVALLWPLLFVWCALVGLGATADEFTYME